MDRSSNTLERPLASRLWYSFVRRSFYLIGVAAYGLRYSGRENVPAEGPVLIVSNHQSHFDPPVLGIGCRRQSNYLARDTLFEIGPLGWFIRSLGAIPIDPEGKSLSGLKESLWRLKRGEMVLIFPEGTRSRDGEIGPFRPGFTALAARSGAAILPAAIEGAFDAWPRWRKFPRGGTIHVHYGPPILPGEIAGRDERQLLAEVQERVRQCQAVLRGRAVFARQRKPEKKS